MTITKKTTCYFWWCNISFFSKKINELNIFRFLFPQSWLKFSIILLSIGCFCDCFNYAIMFNKTKIETGPPSSHNSDCIVIVRCWEKAVFICRCEILIDIQRFLTKLYVRVGILPTCGKTLAWLHYLTI
jgi:hypothetical protein